MRDRARLLPFMLCVMLLGVAACSSVPKQTVELSDTVNRDIDEVHRAHRALAELHFNQIIKQVNDFIDDTYRPAFIAEFAEEFKLNDKVKLILEKDPDKLLPVMTRFVAVATERVEKKRNELLQPIEVQRRDVIDRIDTAYRNIESAQAIVSAHLASVVKVHDLQNDALAKAGLGNLREQISDRTATVSDAVVGIIGKAKEVNSGMDTAKEKLEKFDAVLAAGKEKLSKIAN